MYDNDNATPAPAVKAPAPVEQFPLSSSETTEIVKAVAAATLEFGEIRKTKTVRAGSIVYSFAPLDEVLKGTQKPLAQHGIAITSSPQQHGDGWVCLTQITHTSGQWLRSYCPMFKGTNKNAAQAFASGLSYARRYSLCSLLGIAAQDDDASTVDSGQGAEIIDRRQNRAAILRNLRISMDDVKAWIATRSDLDQWRYWNEGSKDRLFDDLKSGSLSVDDIMGASKPKTRKPRSDKGTKRAPKTAAPTPQKAAQATPQAKTPDDKPTQETLKKTLFPASDAHGNPDPIAFASFKKLCGASFVFVEAMIASMIPNAQSLDKWPPLALGKLMFDINAGTFSEQLDAITGTAKAAHAIDLRDETEKIARMPADEEIPF